MFITLTPLLQNFVEELLVLAEFDDEDEIVKMAVQLTSYLMKSIAQAMKKEAVDSDDDDPFNAPEVVPDKTAKMHSKLFTKVSVVMQFMLNDQGARSKDLNAEIRTDLLDVMMSVMETAQDNPNLVSNEVLGDSTTALMSVMSEATECK